MKRIKLADHLEGVRRHKQALGRVDTPERTEAMRNKGEHRTPEKRELLRRVEERCRAAGITPLKANY